MIFESTTDGSGTIVE